jgi:hypothetical protein
MSDYRKSLENWKKNLISIRNAVEKEYKKAKKAEEK